MDKRKHVDVGELEKLENYLNNAIEGGGNSLSKVDTDVPPPKFGPSQGKKQMAEKRHPKPGQGTKIL